MTDKEKFTAQVIAGLCANQWYVHDKAYTSEGIAKNVVRDAKSIVEEYYNSDTPTA